MTLFPSAQNATTFLLDLLYPTWCAHCKIFVKAAKPLCPTCSCLLELLTPPENKTDSQDILDRIFSKSMSCFAQKSVGASLSRDLLSSQRFFLCEDIAPFLLLQLTSGRYTDPDWLIPMPRTIFQRFKRGLPPAVYLAGELQQWIHSPLSTHLQYSLWSFGSYNRFCLLPSAKRWYRDKKLLLINAGHNRQDLLDVGLLLKATEPSALEVINLIEPM